MLLNIHIKNMALIDEIDINFSDHLNILTGETGAGKSILIDSIMLALGGKAPKDFVRRDAEYGLVELLFTIDNDEMMEQLKAMDIPDISDGQLILSRKIMGNRSIGKANGDNVTLSKLRDIACLMLDLHAQHENQSLLVESNHLKLLDRYGHEEIEPVKASIRSIYNEYSLIKKELSENNINEEEKKRKLDLISFEKNEINSAALKSGEDEEVEALYDKALHGKNIAESLYSVSSILEGETGAGIDRCMRLLSSVSEYDKELSSMNDTLSTASDLISDLNRGIRGYLDDNTFSEEEFIRLENRLNEINHLKAKYGKTIEDILQYGSNLDAEYDRLINQEEYIDGLKCSLEEKEKQLEKLCTSLSKIRKDKAQELTKQIINALKDLNFMDVRFDMVFERLDDYTGDGFDKAYFIISTNVGEHMKPLSSVASGGELSRIMLAMKSCLAKVDNIPTLIFDEIDVGISGRTAQMVAEKICTIGRNHQVICITHLPQIAAFADHHYLIEKKVTDKKTVTEIVKLNKEQEINELARLMGGAKITETVISSAKEMKELAGKAKVD